MMNNIEDSNRGRNTMLLTRKRIGIRQETIEQYFDSKKDEGMLWRYIFKCNYRQTMVD